MSKSANATALPARRMKPSKFFSGKLVVLKNSHFLYQVSNALEQSLRRWMLVSSEI